MPSFLRTFKEKIDDLHNYFFPEEHSISIHHSPANPKTLFYIRVMSLIYLTAIYIWSITSTGSALSNFIYLTMQGYYMTWLYFLLCIQDYLINGFGKWGRVFPLCNNLKYYIQIVFEIAFCVQLPITAIFWGFLFKIILDSNASTEVIIINANLHAGPIVVLCLDIAFNSFSFPKQHFHAVLLFSFLYMVVNLSYSLAAHIIYDPIDWISVMSYVLMVGAVGMAFFMHWLGRFIFHKFKKDKIQSQMLEGLLVESKRDTKNSSTKQSKGSEHKSQDGSGIEDQNNISIITDSL